MTFRAATDRLLALGITMAELAHACGVAHNTIRRARLGPESPAYRPPPGGWEAIVSRMATERAEELSRLARELGEPGD